MKILGCLSVVGIGLGEVILPVLPCRMRTVASTNLAAMHHATVAITPFIGVRIADQAVWGTARGAFPILGLALAVALATFIALLAPFLIFPLSTTLPIIALPLVEILLALLGTLLPTITLT